MKEENYGELIKELRVKTGMTQNQVASALEVTPGYISNVENGRTAMSLRMLIYYSKLMGVTLDSLVGQLEPEYTPSAVDHELLAEINKLSQLQKEKLIKTIKIWNSEEE